MKKPEIKGYIFLCSEHTEAECLERLLFGGGDKYEARVRGLKPGDKLFLYNYRTKELHGIFEAVTGLERDIVPDAWDGEFPQQVKVKRIEEHKPISKDDIDELIIKFDRFNRPSSKLTEEMLVHLEGLFRDEKRNRNYDEARHPTHDGHKVRSKGELLIDNWLYKNRIAHGYEVAILGKKFCDFEIPTMNGNIYIEYWGMNDVEYLKNKEVKLALYKEHDLKLISLYPKDLKSLDEILGAHLLG